MQNIEIRIEQGFNDIDKTIEDCLVDIVKEQKKGERAEILVNEESLKEQRIKGLNLECTSIHCSRIKEPAKN